MRLEIKRKFEAKTFENGSDAGKLHVKLPKLVITKFQGTYLDWQRFWGHLQAERERG